MDSADNVCVVLKEFVPQEDVIYILAGKEFHINAVEHVPIYHKIAVAPVKEGELIYKYGQVIGRAICDIAAGQHVHTHNLVSIRENVGKSIE